MRMRIFVVLLVAFFAHAVFGACSDTTTNNVNTYRCEGTSLAVPAGATKCFLTSKPDQAVSSDQWGSYTVQGTSCIFGSCDTYDIEIGWVYSGVCSSFLTNHPKKSCTSAASCSDSTGWNLGGNVKSAVRIKCTNSVAQCDFTSASFVQTVWNLPPTTMATTTAATTTRPCSSSSCTKCSTTVQGNSFYCPGSSCMVSGVVSNRLQCSCDSPNDDCNDYQNDPTCGGCAGATPSPTPTPQLWSLNVFREGSCSGPIWKTTASPPGVYDCQAEACSAANGYRTRTCSETKPFVPTSGAYEEVFQPGVSSLLLIYVFPKDLLFSQIRHAPNPPQIYGLLSTTSQTLVFCLRVVEASATLVRVRQLLEALIPTMIVRVE